MMMMMIIIIIINQRSWRLIRFYTEKQRDESYFKRSNYKNLFHYRPLRVRRLKLQEFLDSRDKKVANCQPKAPAAFIPTRYSYLC